MALAAAITLALAPGAGAKPQPVSGGKTSLKIKADVGEFLADSGAKLKPIEPAKEKKSGVQFPIKSGELDPNKPKGKLKHNGGIKLKGNGEKFELTKFVAKFGKGSKLSAKLGKKATKLFELDTDKAKVKTKGTTTKVSGVKVITTMTGADLIEDVTGERFEDPEIVFGKLKVAAEVGGGELKLTGGDAGLVLDQSARTKFNTEGVTRGVVAPATKQGDNFSFPVLGGSVAEDGGSGTVRLDGGLRLTKGGTNLDLTKPRLHLGDGEITAVVAGQRRTVMSFSPNRVEVTVEGENVTVTGIAAKLTEEGATAINDAFGGNAFAAGNAIGTFEVEATASAGE
jgi:ribosomal protein L6P/L9E